MSTSGGDGGRKARSTLLWAAAVLFGSRHPRAWALSAAILTLVAFAIPHSAYGTELDYSSPPPSEGSVPGPGAP